MTHFLFLGKLNLVKSTFLKPVQMEQCFLQCAIKSALQQENK